DPLPRSSEEARSSPNAGQVPGKVEAAEACPRGHRPDHHRVPARGPRPCRPVTHGGPQCAGRPPPGGPRRRQTTTPHPPETGRALPHHLVHPYGRPPHAPGTPFSPLNHRGPLPAPASQAPFSLHHQGQRRWEAWRQAGRDTTEVRGRENQARQPREAWGAGVGSKPRGSEGVGRRLATSSGRPTTGRGRPVQGQRREATGRQAAPRREAATRHAAQPARRDRRIRAVRSAARGKAVVAGATGEGAC
ncbi:unnamed protein product, partial [Rangifer tarandus platyrhynchus]